VDHYTYSILGDGDLMEGVVYEAASLAGHLKLGKLICLYDDNRISLAGATDLTFSEDRARRFESQGWHAVHVEDGNDLDLIENAIRAAQAEVKRPSIILVRTQIGYGSPHKQGSFEAHGAPLGSEEVELTKKNLGWPLHPPFFVPDEALSRFRRALDGGKEAEEKWNALFAGYSGKFPDLAQEFMQLIRGELPKDWDANLPVFPADAKGIATRAASGKVINAIGPLIPALIGGSADLDPSTKSALRNAGEFQYPGEMPDDVQGCVGGGWDYRGRNVHFGVREHAMGAVANGMAAHGGIIPYTATFFVFSDYMRPPIRLAALMELGVILIFTHDSIGVGEDGPTHQPVEQLAALRAIPGLIVIRPCDANETVEAWRVAVENRRRPVALVLTRQNVPTLDRTHYAPADSLQRGGYVLADPPNGNFDVILIASGSEVSLITAAQQLLAEKGIAARVVSMPCWELFDAQPQDYRNKVLPPSVSARLAVEAGVSQGWSKYVGDRGRVIGLDHFGASAPSEAVFEKFGFTVENVVNQALSVVSGR
jgi:transketolase